MLRGAMLAFITLAGACGRFGFDAAPDATDAQDSQHSQLAGCTEHISAGREGACAITGGEVWCWGRNNQGQLGTGAAGGSGPVRVPLGAADRVDVGNETTCAHTLDNSVWCWGQGGYGQLTDGSLTDQSNPQQVTLPGGLAAVQVASGGDHHCAILSDATVACWGANTFNQLGTATALPTCNTMPCSSTPLLVAGVSGATQIATGRTTPAR